MAGDDGAGIEIVRRLRSIGGFGCRLLEMSQSGVDLLDILQETNIVVFVDAVVSGSEAGMLHILSLPSPDLQPRTLSTLSSHGWGLAEMLDLCHALGRPVPSMYLLGIEIHSTTDSTSLSTAVENSLDFAVEHFSSILALIGCEPSAGHLPMHIVPGRDDSRLESLCA